MEEIIIDCSPIRTKDDLHRMFRDALSFPDWYGNNLDALYDCLTDLRNIHLILENWDALPDWRAIFKTVFEDAENDGRGLIITFA